MPEERLYLLIIGAFPGWLLLLVDPINKLHAACNRLFGQDNRPEFEQTSSGPESAVIHEVVVFSKPNL